MNYKKIILSALLALQGVQAFAYEQSTYDAALKWMAAQKAAAEAAAAHQPTTTAVVTATTVTAVATPVPVIAVATPAPVIITGPTIYNANGTVNVPQEDAVDEHPLHNVEVTPAVPLPSPLEISHAETLGNINNADFVASLIKFDFMHTKQNCAIVEGEVTHKSTYCTGDKMAEMTALSGMVKEINAQLDTTLAAPEKAKVSVAYFSFSNSGVQNKLCELSSKGVEIRVFLDGGSTGQIDKLILNNPACKDASGKLNVKISYLGGSTDGGAGGVWRLHHNKFLMIDTGAATVKLNFSSGNLSSFGTSLHLDHWVMTEAPRNSNLIKAQRCVMEGLESAADVKNMLDNPDPVAADQEIAQAYIDKREQCFDENKVIPRVSAGNIETQIAEALKKEEIAPLFSPNNNSYVEKSLINAINRIPSNGYMYIAIQHFLHQGVANALMAASKKGVDVRIIMDDDALRGESEVPGVDKMIMNLMQQTPKMQIRFAETNHNAGGNGSMMHNKLAILNGKMTFSGAGHYTNAALRKNWENFYFVSNKVTISNYAKYFSELWSNSVDINYVKSNGANKGANPAALNPEFVHLTK